MMANNDSKVLAGNIVFTNQKSRWQFTEYNPDDLVALKGLSVYKKMLKDEQVKACMHLRKFAVLSSGWRVDPRSEAPEDIEKRDFIAYVLDKIKNTFNEKLLLIMSALEYGFSVSEKSFMVDDKDYKERIVIEDIRGKDPETFEFKMDPYGKLLLLIQEFNSGLEDAQKNNKNFLKERFVVFSYNKGFENYYGDSVLRAAYRSWVSKDNTIKFWNMFNERLGSPTPIGTIENKAAHHTSDLATVLDNLQSKTYIILPEGITLSLLEAKSGSGETPFERAINYFDTAISRACLVPSNLGFSPQGNTGSLAQAKAQFSSFLNWIVKPDQTLLEDVVNEQIIKPLLVMNYGHDYKCPSFKFNSLPQLELERLAEVWIKAVSGKAVKNRLDDENTFRKLLDFPERKENKNDQPVERVSTEEIEEEHSTDTRKDFNNIGEYIQRVNANTEKFYAITTAEKRMDFSSVTRELDSIEESAINGLTSIYIEQKQDIIKDISRAYNKENLSATYINGLKLSKSSALANQYGVMQKSAFIAGRNRAIDLIPSGIKSRITQKDQIKKFAIDVGASEFKPIEALKHFEKKKFWITGTQNNKLLSEIQSILWQYMDAADGSTLKTITKRIDEVYEKYIDEKENLGAQTSGYRIETVVRTNATESYTIGMLNVFRSPDVSEFVPAVQYSAILDNRTTPICQHLHGKQLKTNSPEVSGFTPPNHFNCRSLWLPVFINEPFLPMTKTELNKAGRLVSDKFRL